MTNYYIEESGYYKITKNIEADNKEEAIWYLQRELENE